jgi:hypothetical protein
VNDLGGERKDITFMTPPPPPTLIDSEEEYEVEAILDSCMYYN